MKITIHQPEHMVWLGLIDKISQADLFVVLDTVQFEKNYYQNRNKIRTTQGWTWLTVPLKKHPSATLIKDIEITDGNIWKRKYLNLIKQSYGKTKFFQTLFRDIEKTMLTEYQFLSDLNLSLLKRVLKYFNVNTKIIKASSIEIPSVKGGTAVNHSICKALHGTCYLSGPSGKDYLDLTPFHNDNIEVLFHEFSHPVYKQAQEPFLPFMSSIDLLFNYGPHAIEILWPKLHKKSE